MPSKKELAALLSEASPQPLRRGRGLRLSRSSKQAPKLSSKPSGPPEPAAEPAPVAQPIAPDGALPGLGAPAGAPIESAASPTPDARKPERKQRKLLLRKDLLKQCKRIARKQDRKLYQVVESALEEYIQRYGAHE